MWDFAFSYPYQSTDETDGESVVDPDTDTSEAENAKVSTGTRSWITRPPMYRAPEVFLAVWWQN